MKTKARVIAFYLPQYYPIPENDEWWGKGFTEWTNVGKAKPLWKNHYQPRVPADLGYYDLRIPEVREQQVELAREAGVTAFCYWHYWFGNGKRLLARVFDEVLESGKPDFPFCLGWANHSWYAKTWDRTGSDKLLMEQTYPGIDDAKEHFAFLLKAFKDPRYVKVNGAPFLFVFEPRYLPQQYIEWFRTWTKEAGFPDIYLVANVVWENDYNKYLDCGYNAILHNRLAKPRETYWANVSKTEKYIDKVTRYVKEKLIGIPRNALDYKKYIPILIDKIVDSRIEVIPEIVPQWDHSPRSGNRKGPAVLYNSTPELFYQHVKEALNVIKDKPEENQILILKSWNEWAEGNYMEPDLKNGKGFIKALRKALEEFNKTR